MQVDVTLETEVEKEVHHLVSGILGLLFLLWLGNSFPPVHLNQKVIQEFVTRASEERQNDIKGSDSKEDDNKKI